MQEIEQLAGTLGHFDTVVAWYFVAAHSVGGASLALGLATRFSAAVNIPVLLGAVIFVHSSGGLFSPGQGLEFSLFVLLALILIVWHGSGKVSLDRLLGQSPLETQPS